MKLKTLLSLVFIMFLGTFSMLAQDGTNPAIDFSVYVISFGAVIATTVVVTDLLNKALKTSGLGLQIVSWLTGVAISLAGDLLNLGMFTEFELWQSLLIGVGASLAANGVADTGLIKGILLLVGINVDKNKS